MILAEVVNRAMLITQPHAGMFQVSLIFYSRTMIHTTGFTSTLEDLRFL